MASMARTQMEQLILALEQSDDAGDDVRRCMTQATINECLQAVEHASDRVAAASFRGSVVDIQPDLYSAWRNVEQARTEEYELRLLGAILMRAASVAGKAQDQCTDLDGLAVNAAGILVRNGATDRIITALIQCGCRDFSKQPSVPSATAVDAADPRAAACLVNHVRRGLLLDSLLRLFQFSPCTPEQFMILCPSPQRGGMQSTSPSGRSLAHGLHVPPMDVLPLDRLSLPPFEQEMFTRMDAEMRRQGKRGYTPVPLAHLAPHTGIPAVGDAFPDLPLDGPGSCVICGPRMDHSTFGCTRLHDTWQEGSASEHNDSDWEWSGIRSGPAHRAVRQAVRSLLTGPGPQEMQLLASALGGVNEAAQLLVSRQGSTMLFVLLQALRLDLVARFPTTESVLRRSLDGQSLTHPLLQGRPGLRVPEAWSQRLQSLAHSGRNVLACAEAWIEDVACTIPSARGVDADETVRNVLSMSTASSCPYTPLVMSIAAVLALDRAGARVVGQAHENAGAGEEMRPMDTLQDENSRVSHLYSGMLQVEDDASFSPLLDLLHAPRASRQVLGACIGHGAGGMRMAVDISVGLAGAAGHCVRAVHTLMFQPPRASQVRAQLRSSRAPLPSPLDPVLDLDAVIDGWATVCQDGQLARASNRAVGGGEGNGAVAEGGVYCDLARLVATAVLVARQHAVPVSLPLSRAPTLFSPRSTHMGLGEEGEGDGTGGGAEAHLGLIGRILGPFYACLTGECDPGLACASGELHALVALLQTFRWHGQDEEAASFWEYALSGQEPLAIILTGAALLYPVQVSLLAQAVEAVSVGPAACVAAADWLARVPTLTLVHAPGAGDADAWGGSGCSVTEALLRMRGASALRASTDTEEGWAGGEASPVMPLPLQAGDVSRVVQLVRTLPLPAEGEMLRPSMGVSGIALASQDAASWSGTIVALHTHSAWAVLVRRLLALDGALFGRNSGGEVRAGHAAAMAVLTRQSVPGLYVGGDGGARLTASAAQCISALDSTLAEADALFALLSASLRDGRGGRGGGAADFLAACTAALIDQRTHAGGPDGIEAGRGEGLAAALVRVAMNMLRAVKALLDGKGAGASPLLSPGQLGLGPLLSPLLSHCRALLLSASVLCERLAGGCGQWVVLALAGMESADGGPAPNPPLLLAALDAVRTLPPTPTPHAALSTLSLARCLEATVQAIAARRGRTDAALFLDRCGMDVDTDMGYVDMTALERALGEVSIGRGGPAEAAAGLVAALGGRGAGVTLPFTSFSRNLAACAQQCNAGGSGGVGPAMDLLRLLTRSSPSTRAAEDALLRGSGERAMAMLQHAHDCIEGTVGGGEVHAATLAVGFREQTLACSLLNTCLSAWHVSLASLCSSGEPTPLPAYVCRALIENPFLLRVLGNACSVSVRLAARGAASGIGQVAPSPSPSPASALHAALSDGLPPSNLGRCTPSSLSSLTHSLLWREEGVEVQEASVRACVTLGKVLQVGMTSGRAGGGALEAGQWNSPATLAVAVLALTDSQMMGGGGAAYDFGSARAAPPSVPQPLLHALIALSGSTCTRVAVHALHALAWVTATLSAGSHSVDRDKGRYAIARLVTPLLLSDLRHYICGDAPPTSSSRATDMTRLLAGIRLARLALDEQPGLAVALLEGPVGPAHARAHATVSSRVAAFLLAQCRPTPTPDSSSYSLLQSCTLHESLLLACAVSRSARERGVLLLSAATLLCTGGHGRLNVWDGLAAVISRTDPTLSIDEGEGEGDLCLLEGLSCRAVCLAAQEAALACVRYEVGAARGHAHLRACKEAMRQLPAMLTRAIGRGTGSSALFGAAAECSLASHAFACAADAGVSLSSFEVEVGAVGLDSVCPPVCRGWEGEGGSIVSAALAQAVRGHEGGGATSPPYPTSLLARLRPEDEALRPTPPACLTLQRVRILSPPLDCARLTACLQLQVGVEEGEGRWAGRARATGAHAARTRADRSCLASASLMNAGRQVGAGQVRLLHETVSCALALSVEGQETSCAPPLPLLDSALSVLTSLALLLKAGLGEDSEGDGTGAALPPASLLAYCQCVHALVEGAGALLTPTLEGVVRQCKGGGGFGAELLMLAAAAVANASLRLVPHPSTFGSAWGTAAGGACMAALWLHARLARLACTLCLALGECRMVGREGVLLTCLADGAMQATGSMGGEGCVRAVVAPLLASHSAVLFGIALDPALSVASGQAGDVSLLTAKCGAITDSLACLRCAVSSGHGHDPSPPWLFLTLSRLRTCIVDTGSGLEAEGLARLQGWAGGTRGATVGVDTLALSTALHACVDTCVALAGLGGDGEGVASLLAAGLPQAVSSLSLWSLAEHTHAARALCGADKEGEGGASTCPTPVDAARLDCGPAARALADRCGVPHEGEAPPLVLSLASAVHALQEGGRWSAGEAVGLGYGYGPSPSRGYVFRSPCPESGEPGSARSVAIRDPTHAAWTSTARLLSACMEGVEEGAEGAAAAYAAAARLVTAHPLTMHSVLLCRQYSVGVARESEAVARLCAGLYREGCGCGPWSAWMLAAGVPGMGTSPSPSPSECVLAAEAERGDEEGEGGWAGLRGGWGATRHRYVQPLLLPTAAAYALRDATLFLGARLPVPHPHLLQSWTGGEGGPTHPLVAHTLEVQAANASTAQASPRTAYSLYGWTFQPVSLVEHDGEGVGGGWEWVALQGLLGVLGGCVALLTACGRAGGAGGWVPPPMSHPSSLSLSVWRGGGKAASPLTPPPAPLPLYTHIATALHAALEAGGARESPLLPLCRPTPTPTPMCSTLLSLADAESAQAAAVPGLAHVLRVVGLALEAVAVGQGGAGEAQYVGLLRSALTLASLITVHACTMARLLPTALTSSSFASALSVLGNGGMLSAVRALEGQAEEEDGEGEGGHLISPGGRPRGRSASGSVVGGGTVLSRLTGTSVLATSMVGLGGRGGEEQGGRTTAALLYAAEQGEGEDGESHRRQALQDILSILLALQARVSVDRLECYRDRGVGGGGAVTRQLRDMLMRAVHARPTGSGGAPTLIDFLMSGGAGGAVA